MAFRLVSSGGSISDPAVINMSASGVVKVGEAVDFLRVSGSGVGPSGSASTVTMVFGIALDYAQGASDVQVKVIPFTDDQIWEVDCANAATTAQVGIRHAFGTRGAVHNTATDVTANTGVFLALAMTGLTTGSGKLLGRFVSNLVPVGQNQTTFA
jgi:hypothetical protein